MSGLQDYLDLKAMWDSWENQENLEHQVKKVLQEKSELLQVNQARKETLVYLEIPDLKV